MTPNIGGQSSFITEGNVYISSIVTKHVPIIFTYYWARFKEDVNPSTAVD